jgi:hypothetical protein
LPFVVVIVAIVGGGAVKIVKAIIRHRERLAMIDMGIHPDYPPLEEETPLDGHTPAALGRTGSSDAQRAGAAGPEAHTPGGK